MAQMELLSYAGLTQYDGLIKTYIGTEDAKSIKCGAISADGASFYLFKDETVPTTAGGEIDTTKAVATIPLSGNDIGDLANLSTTDKTNLVAAINEVDGDLATLSGSLAAVATSGAAADVSIADTAGLITAVTVEGALAELASAASGGVASKTLYLQDESAGQSEYAKVYKFYQGSNTSDMTQNTLVGTINVPLDKVLQAAELVTQDDQGNTGHFLKLTFQNVATDIYVDLSVLADTYTAQANAAEVQVAVNDYTISASIVDIDASKITYIAADATADPAIARESVKAALTRLDAAIGTGGSVDSKIAAAIAALDAKISTDGATGSTAPTADASTQRKVLSEITETDGVLTGGKYVELADVAVTGAAADVSIADTGSLITATTVEGALAEIAGDVDALETLVGDGYTAITSAQINALFS